MRTLDIYSMCIVKVLMKTAAIKNKENSMRCRLHKTKYTVSNLG